MSSLFNRKRCLSLFMIFIVVFQSLFLSFIPSTSVYADSNDRRQALIDFSKGKSASDISTLGTLTYDDLRMIGLFLSNFYIPWNTGVGMTYDDDSVKEQMSEALESSCGFDSDISEYLVESIFSMSVSTRKPLAIANGDINGNLMNSTDLIIVNNNENAIKSTVLESYPDATLYTFWGCMTGGFHYNDAGVFGGNRLITDTYADKEAIEGDERFYMFWSDGDVKHIVWEMDKGSIENDIEFTPCTASYLMMMDDADYSNGNAGNALLSVSEKNYSKLKTEEQKSRVEMWNADMFVDCFGNILCDVGTQLYVVVPACNNPYAWYSVSGGEATAGKYMQLLNFFNIGEMKSGHITTSDNDFTVNSDIYTCFENGGGSFNYNFYSSTEDKHNSLYNIKFFRVSRGSNRYKLDEKIGWWGRGDLAGLLDKESGGYGFSQPDSHEGAIFTNFLTFEGSVTDDTIGKSDFKKISSFTGHSGAFSDMIMIDRYQTWQDSKDFTSLPRTTIFHKNSEGTGFECIDTSIGMSFNSVLEDNAITKIGASDKKWVVSIYLSYLFAYDNANGGDNGKNISYAFNKNGLPRADEGNVDFSGLKISNTGIQEKLQSMLYYLLHPVQGVSYVAKWFINKVSGILVAWHEDMVGTSSSASTTGGTKYLGFTGYVTLPTLSDIPWTAWLLNEYNNFVIYLIIIMFLIMIIHCMLGSMTFQRAILGTLIFMVLVLLPPLSVNACANFINKSCDDIYGDKFTYWALVQHQTYINNLQKANLAENKSDYLKVVFNDMLGEDGDISDYTTVKLKWMSPKKDNVLSNVLSEVNSSVSSTGTLSLMRDVMTDVVSGESFTDSDNSLYLYRDYSDLYMYQANAYRCESNIISPIVGYNPEYVQSGTGEYMTYPSGKTMYSVSSNIDNIIDSTSLASAQFYGFLVNTTSKIGSSNKSFSYLLDSGVGIHMLDQVSKFNNSDLSISGNNLGSSTFGISNESYSLTLANIVNGTGTDGNYLYDNTEDQKELGYFYYGLYTESPFYFFTWNIYDQTNSSDFNCGVSETSSGSLIDMYTMDDQSYFFNNKSASSNGYGELRDFCNMRSLFYYVIPYLRSCNKLVLDWDEKYGLFMYDDVKLQYGSDGETVVVPDFSTKTGEYTYKWWHNYNVERLFNVYCPWVDTLYDCDYAKSETISILGEKYLVQDPLDPTSYYEVDASGALKSGRPMVFSRSEMGYYGLEMDDLTGVEQKIIQVQDKVYEDLLQLMDYYNFNDDVLITSAGMLTTFAFNNEFSQNNPIGKSYVLYPSNYELKTFTYDAYLRLILAESTGEDLMVTEGGNKKENTEYKSYYRRIVEKSSITTAIGFIFLDLIAVYAIPALKLFFLVGIFFMSVLMIVSSSLNSETGKPAIKSAVTGLVVPLAQFSVVSIGMSWLVSLFMSNGNTSVTNRGGLTISLGDPMMVVLVMLVINIGVLILYYKICKKCLTKLVNLLKTVALGAVGLTAGVAGTVLGGIGRFIGNRFKKRRDINVVAKGINKSKEMSDSQEADASGGGGGTANSRGMSNSQGATTSGEGDGSAKKRLLSGRNTGGLRGNDAKLKKYNEKAAKFDERANKTAQKIDNRSGDTHKAKYESAKEKHDMLKSQSDELKNFVNNNRSNLSTKQLKQCNKDIAKVDKQLIKAKKVEDKRLSSYNKRVSKYNSSSAGSTLDGRFANQVSYSEYNKLRANQIKAQNKLANRGASKSSSPKKGK